MIVINKQFIDFDKEEAWLDDMAKQGLNLQRYAWGKYYFEKCEPGQYQYKVEPLGTNDAKKKQEYLDFLQQSGIEVVMIHQKSRMYLRRQAADTPFVVHTDIDGQIQHYRAARGLWVQILMPMAFTAAVLAMSVCFPLGISALAKGIVLGTSAAIVLAGVAIYIRFVTPYNRRITALKREQRVRE